VNNSNNIITCFLNVTSDAVLLSADLINIGLIRFHGYVSEYFHAVSFGLGLVLTSLVSTPT